MGMTISQSEIDRRWAAVKKHQDTGLGWMQRAANDLGIAGSTFRSWCQKHNIYVGSPVVEPPEPKEPEEPLAMRQERKFRDEITRLKSELSATHRELNSAEDLREAVFGLQDPIQPAHFKPNLEISAADGVEIPILFQSDEQWGEVIKREEMGGLNAYNQDIASNRYRRLIESTIKCCLPPNAPKAPPMIYYLMGGDSISGSIHEELAETNDLSSPPGS